ncbi:MAG: inositol monophosphatase family protein [Blastocatellia bacterium]
MTIPEFAIDIAREAGDILREYAARGFEITHKGRINLVTEADLASEKHLKQRIGAAFPAHRIIAEESGVSHHQDFDYCWIIDPLDGTTNFAHGFPCFAVSIGIEHRGELVAGIIYDPTRDEMFVAERGAGATLNGQKIRVSDVEPLEKALLVTGFPYDVRERMHEYLPALEAFLATSQGVRRFGAAAIDMAYVACGRVDGFWENGLHAWDGAAGAVIVSEAGGRLSNLDGGPFDPFVPSLLCSNGRIHDEALAVLRTVRT